eukprot:scaffold89351_cov31-Tisochrysis_lutea.AAC.1
MYAFEGVMGLGVVRRAVCVTPREKSSELAVLGLIEGFCAAQELELVDPSLSRLGLVAPPPAFTSRGW